MNYTVSNPTAMGCYIQAKPNLKTMDVVKSELGADVIVNFQLFSLTGYEHCGTLKVDGKVWASYYNFWGYGWNNGDTKLVLGKRDDIMNRYDNFSGCVLVAKDGKVIQSPEFGNLFPGTRGRTGIGRKANGDVVIYCWQDGTSGAATLQQLGKRMIDLGCVDAINFDGGGSCQMRCPSGSVYSARKVASMLWFKLPKPAPGTNPYPTPTRNLYRGCRGEDVKWLQYVLNQQGASPVLVVDGDFGYNTRNAVIAYQRSHGLYVDGVVGPNTMRVLTA